MLSWPKLHFKVISQAEISSVVQVFACGSGWIPLKRVVRDFLARVMIRSPVGSVTLIWSNKRNHNRALQNSQ